MRPLLPRVANVKVCAIRVVRMSCVIAGALLLAGCAICETTTNTRARQSASLKDAPWALADMTPAKQPKVLSYFRSAEPRPIRPMAKGPATHETGSCDTADQCALLLRLMVDDPTRSWIGQRPSAAVYANGTRLFAYRALRGKLSCSELALALEETRVAAKSFGTPAAGVTVDQATRVRTMNTQVASELQSEREVRCKGDPITPSG